MPDLSAQALAVCAEHWRPRGADCGRCPIRSACTSPTQPLSQATLDAWRQRVNSAAAAIGQSMDGSDGRELMEGSDG